MENRKLAVTIGLIFFSASIAIPVKGHSADLLKGLVGSITNEAIKREAQKAATSANQQSTATTRDETRRTQAALNRNGYPAGPADGIAGNKTRAAIRAYQLDNGWPATGTLTDAQRARLLGVADSGVAAVATSLVPLLLDDGGRSAAGIATVTTPSLKSNGLNSTEVKRTRTSGNTGSTTGSVGSEPGQNLTATGNSDALLERNASAVTNRETLDGEGTNQITLRQQQRQLFDNGGSPVVVGATDNAGTTASTTTSSVDAGTQVRQVPSTRTPVGECTNASRRREPCEPSQ